MKNKDKQDGSIFNPFTCENEAIAACNKIFRETKEPVLLITTYEEAGSKYELIPYHFVGIDIINNRHHFHQIFLKG